MNITYYEKQNGEIPVMKYLESLNLKFQAKILKEIDMLELYGLDLGKPYVSKIEGKKYNKLFELRTKFSSNISRIFYFCKGKYGFVLLSAYTKKQNKTDKKELDKALNYMIDFNNRFGGNNE